MPRSSLVAGERLNKSLNSLFYGRDVEKAKRAALEIKEETGEDIIIEPLDLADVSSVKKFAERCLQESRLDILVNNAGVMMPVKGLKTKQNFEVSFYNMPHIWLKVVITGLVLVHISKLKLWA